MQFKNCRLAGAAMLAAVTCAPLAGWAAPPVGYAETKLVSNVAGRALHTDPNLVNPWGVAFFPGGAFWISDNGTGLSTLYDGLGDIIPAVFTVPPPAHAGGHSAPTGIIINTTFGFLVPGTSLPAQFIFSTEDGTISAWNGSQPNSSTAVLAVDNSASGAVYKGLEFGVTAAGTFIYATNFHAGTVDVFGSNFASANSKLLGTFSDPALPAGYAPFGIRNINGNLFVTYALQDAEKHDDAPGRGHGYVDVFDTDGRLLQRFAQTGVLNSPWAVALAPAGFGPLSNDVLIGNFGNGQINAYDLSGIYVGALSDQHGRAIAVQGLWGLYFGGASASTPDTLFFTAGSNHEANGLFGSIAPN